MSAINYSAYIWLTPDISLFGEMKGWEKYFNNSSMICMAEYGEGGNLGRRHSRMLAHVYLYVLLLIAILTGEVDKHPCISK